MAHQEQIEGTDIVVRYPVKKRPVDCANCTLRGRTKCHGSGDPNSPLWFVGEAPGAEEAQDDRKIPFIGRAGKLLWKVVAEVLGLTREQVYVANICDCWPDGNRTPTKLERKCCAGHLELALEKYKPVTVVALGAVALNTLVSDKLKITESAGHEFLREDGIKVLASNHPSYIVRTGMVLLDNFRKHISRAKHSVKTRELVDFDAVSGYNVKLLDHAGFEKYIQFILKRPWAAFDIETGKGQVPFLISSGYGGTVGVVAYWDEVVDLLPQVFEASKLGKVFQFGCGFDIPIIEHHAKCHVTNYFWDTFSAGLVMDSRGGVNNLDALCEWAVPDLAGYSSELERYKKKYKIKDDYSLIPPEIIIPYAGKDAIATGLVCAKQMGLLKPDKVALMHFYNDFIREVLYPMERFGVKVDTDFLAEMIVQLQAQFDALTIDIKQYSKNPDFNPGSDKQLAELLFDKLRLPLTGVKTSKKTGRPSVNVKTLALLADKHPVIKLVGARRSVDKLLGTYAERIKRELTPEGRFRIKYWVGSPDREEDKERGTETGRLSSTMQNVPRVNKEKPRQYEPADIFIPDEGKVLLVPDYSQLELRIGTIRTKDKRMIAAFKSGHDFHDETCWTLLKAPRGAKPPKELRVKAKHVNFAKVFGASARGLAAQIGCTIQEAAKLLEDDSQLYVEYWAWRQAQIEETLENGYCETMFGLRRPIDIPIDEHDYHMFDLHHWQRQALNTPIQGTAGQLLFLAQLIIKRHNIPGLDIIMNIHDSSPVQVPPRILDKAAKLVKRTMEHDVVEESWRRFKVDFSIIPLVVEMETGLRFSQLKPFTV